MLTVQSGHTKLPIQTGQSALCPQPKSAIAPRFGSVQVGDQWIKTGLRFAANNDEKRKEAYKRFTDKLTSGITMIERTLKVLKLGSNDEKVQLISQMLWDKQLKPMVVDHPAETKAQIIKWRDTVMREGEPGVMRDTALMVLNSFEKNLDKPEKIQKTVNLATKVMLNGGMEKAKDILALVSSNSFQNENVTKQGQLLLEAMGPVFVKALQTINSVPDLFPDHIQDSIKPLYEDTSPIPFEKIRSIIETEMEKKNGTRLPLEELFAWFNPEPIKAASIAQVHEALLKNGKRVAVKIVKEGVKDNIDKNMDLLEPLANLAQELDGRFNAQKFLGDFRGLIKKECDMQQEADQLEKVAEVFKKIPNLRVPEVYRDLSSESVLTMEFMEGDSLHKHVGNPKVAKAYLDLLLDMVFVHRACQADPHFGNVPYNPEKDVFNFLDAGMVYYTSDKEITNFAKLLTAIPLRKADILAEALLNNDENKGKEAQRKDFEEAIKPILEGDFEFKARDVIKMIRDIEKEARKRDLKINLTNPLLWKTMFTAINVARTLDPNLNVMKEVGFSVFSVLFKNDRSFLFKVGMGQFNSWAGKWYSSGKSSAKSTVGSWVEKGKDKAAGWFKGLFKKKTPPPEGGGGGG